MGKKYGCGGTFICNVFGSTSGSHYNAVLIILLFISRKKWSVQPKYFERIFALSLFGIDILYHCWLIGAGRWNLSDTLPLELCSISLGVTIILLWTGNRHLYDFVFFAGMQELAQAIGFPDAYITVFPISGSSTFFTRISE